ncbi:MAG: hypothetical protein HY791_16810 [Deltaproteobacteria bacterium]|nr:hypothetical protein [Deltaproteobacteria bacterium]
MRVAALLAVLGCGPGVELVVPWSPEENGIIVLVNEATGVPFREPWLVPAGRDEPIRVGVTEEEALVYALAYGSGPPFPCASVAASGPGEALPAPSRAWSAPLTERPMFEVVADPQSHGLVGVGCQPECPSLASTSYSAVDTPHGLRFVIAVGSGQSLLGDQNINLFVRDSNGALSEAPRDSRLRGELEDLSFDGSTLIFGVSSTGSFFAVDTRGRLKWIENTPRAYFNVAARRDGSAVATGVDPQTHEYLLARLTAGSTVPQTLDVPFRPSDVVTLSDGLVLAAEMTTGVVYSFDGSSWTLEVSVSDPVLESDGETALLISFDGSAQLRGLDGRWTPIPPIPPSIDLRRVTALDHGRYLVAAEAGIVAIWTGSRWCEYDTTTGITFRKGTLAPDELVVFLAGRLGEEDVVVTVGLPRQTGG